MDIFNVTDQDRNKVTDEGILEYIQKSLGPDSCFLSSMRRSVGVMPSMDHTYIELAGCDRPGLLSEASVVLTHLKCNVVNAEMWTHNNRAAAVMHVTVEETGSAITESELFQPIYGFASGDPLRFKRAARQKDLFYIDDKELISLIYSLL